jgi:hypothetical protein
LVVIAAHAGFEGFEGEVESLDGGVRGTVKGCGGEMLVTARGEQRAPEEDVRAGAALAGLPEYVERLAEVAASRVVVAESDRKESEVDLADADGDEGTELTVDVGPLLQVPTGGGEVSIQHRRHRQRTERAGHAPQIAVGSQ